MSEAEMFFQGELIIRIVLAGICGAIIGNERRNRLKEAGIRTHVIVAIGSALIMTISKYGFFDIDSYDASRVAAQIVSGVGFLGAGVIFVKKENVSGLTTAAGLWTTAGIGMAIGAGLYIVGIASAILVILIQIILHNSKGLFKEMVMNRFILDLENTAEAKKFLDVLLDDDSLEVVSYKAKSGEYKHISMTIKFNSLKKQSMFLQNIRNSEYVKEVQM